VEAYGTLTKPLNDLLAQWQAVKDGELKALNTALGEQHLGTLSLNTNGIDHSVEDQIELGDVE
jgi:hypothetical protein